MIEIDIPGGERLQLSHLVLDYNGTLALDGELLFGVAGKMERLSEKLQVHVITADTHGTVGKKLTGLPCKLHIIGAREQDRQKHEYLQNLGMENVAAIGNGRNDGLLLKNAGLGIALVQGEGAAVSTLLQADVVCTSILDGLDLLLLPDRLRATLRN